MLTRVRAEAHHTQLPAPLPLEDSQVSYLCSRGLPERSFADQDHVIHLSATVGRHRTSRGDTERHETQ